MAETDPKVQQLDHPHHRLLRAMRIQKNEPQLTRAIAALAADEPAFVAALARTLLLTAADQAGSVTAREFARRVPGELRLSGEQGAGTGRLRMFGKPIRLGRFDWELFDDVGFRMIVEVKVGARPATGQLERYLRALARDGGRGGLLLLTREHSDVRRRVAHNSLWLGQIRWDQLLPAWTTSRPRIR